MTITTGTVLTTKFGVFDVKYHKIGDAELVSLAHGNIASGRPLVRIQSACLFGQTLSSLQCDCYWQLQAALSQIAAGNGVVVFSPRGEGKGAGLGPKVRAMELERVGGYDPIEAYRQLGLPGDLRDFSAEVQALIELGVSKKIRMSTENKRKQDAILKAGFEVVP